MGLTAFDELRERLSPVMLKALHRRVVIHGRNLQSYTSRFLRWYAQYYHGIDADFVVIDENPDGIPLAPGFYRQNVYLYNYKDIRDGIVWLAVPLDKEHRDLMEQYGFEKDKTYFDFYRLIYGSDITGEDTGGDAVHKRKSVMRDIQFLEWLEFKYGCNFLTTIPMQNIDLPSGGHGYKVSSPMQLFPILDKCHCRPKAGDSIFDFGCGKGGPMVSFLDYGFEKAGGVEYDPNIYDVLCDNIKRLGLEDSCECINENAINLKEKLDGYNWFFFYQPFTDDVFEIVLSNIVESLKRRPRKVHGIYINYKIEDIIERSGVFRTQMLMESQTRMKISGYFTN